MTSTIDQNKSELENKYHLRTRCSKWVYILFYIAMSLSILILLYLITCLVFLVNFPFPERSQGHLMSPIMKEHLMHVSISLYLSIIFIILPIFFILQIMAIILSRQILGWKVSKKYALEANIPWYNRMLWIIVTFFFVLLPPLFIWFLIYPLYKFEKIRVDHKHKDNVKRVKKNKALITGFSVLALTTTALTPAYLYAFIKINNNYINKNTPQRSEEIQKSLTLSKNKQNTIILYFDRLHGAYWNEMLALDYALFNKDSQYLINSKTKSDKQPYLGKVLFPNEKEEDIEKFQGTSFVELFPEFTSYFNFLSNASVTNLSNPGINGSWFLDSKLKNSSLINPLTNNKYKDETNDENLLQGYKFNLRMFQDNNYNNLSMFNNPYYSKPTWHWSANTTNLQNDLNRDLKKENDQSIKVYNRNETIKGQGEHITFSQKDDVKNFQHLGAHKNTIYNQIKNSSSAFPSNQIKDLDQYISFTSDKLNKPMGANEPLELYGKEVRNNLTTKDGDSSMIFFHSNFTHEVYTTIGNDKLKSDFNPSGLDYMNPSLGTDQVLGRFPESQMDVMWYLLQKLKDFMFYLKNLPYTGNDSDVIKNQYDNTNIYILSDHGNNYYMGDNPKHDKLLNFLINDLSYSNKQKAEDAKKTYDKFKENLDYCQDISFYNAVFARKPRKYKNLSSLNKTITSSPFIDFFNSDRLLTLNDVMPIIESDLEKIKQDQEGKTTFSFDENASKINQMKNKMINENKDISDSRIKNMVDKNIIVNPLSDDKKKLLNQRQFALVYGEYGYNGNQKNNSLLDIFTFDNSYGLSEGQPQKPLSGKIEDSIYNPHKYIKSKY